MNYYEIGFLIYMILILLFLGSNIYLLLRKPEKLRKHYLFGVLLYCLITLLPLLNANTAVMNNNIVQMVLALVITDFRKIIMSDYLSLMVNVVFITGAICYIVIIFIRTIINIKSGISPKDAVVIPIGYIYSFLWLMIGVSSSTISSWYVMVLLVFLVAYFLYAWYYLDIKSFKGIIRCIRVKKKEKQIK